MDRARGFWLIADRVGDVKGVGSPFAGDVITPATATGEPKPPPLSTVLPSKPLSAGPKSKAAVFIRGGPPKNDDTADEAAVGDASPLLAHRPDTAPLPDNSGSTVELPGTCLPIQGCKHAASTDSRVLAT